VLWHCWLFARNGLGFIFDSHLTFSDQISSLSKSCYYHIRELRCIRPYLNLKTTSTIVTSIVHSKLDYCNSLYYNLPKSQTIVFRLFRTLLLWLWLRLPNSVTSRLFSNLYIGLNSMNALNTNFFPLPIKLSPLLNLLICTAWSLFSPSCYSLLICCHPFSTAYIVFSKNHQSLIPLCITSSLGSTSCFIPSALHKTPCWWCHTLYFTSTCSPLSPSITHSLFHSRFITHLFHKSSPL